MRIHVLDLDSGICRQQALCDDVRAEVFPLNSWGPRIRLACRFGVFRQFEQQLASLLGRHCREEPVVTFYGSGDFHHVSLALVRHMTTPFNLLVLDNHPDWMRGVPLLHCGTWLYHAARLPLVQRIIHVGGDVDFDNAYRWMAPWPHLHSGKITVIPAVRRYQRGPWCRIAHEPLRSSARIPASAERIVELVHPLRDDLRRWPLYISLDKDVMVAADSVVNWDSGHLCLPEVQRVLATFLEAAGGKVAGIDIVGDWSPVRVRGALRSLLHLTEHPALSVDAVQATRCNEQCNLSLLGTFAKGVTIGERHLTIQHSGTMVKQESNQAQSRLRSPQDNYEVTDANQPRSNH